MNLRDQLEDVQDKLESVRDELSAVSDLVEFMKDLKSLFADLTKARKGGTRDSAMSIFVEIEELVSEMDPNLEGLETSVQDLIDLLS